MSNGSILRWLAAWAFFMLLAGCEHQQQAKVEEFEPAMTVNKIIALQAANGAADDATLHKVHFSGNAINSLGLEKLQQMQAGTAKDQTMMVYLNLPENDPRLALRRQSVIKAIQDLGMSERDYEMVVGPNPVGKPVNEGMAGLKKLQGEECSAGGSPGGTDPMKTATDMMQSMAGGK